MNGFSTNKATVLLDFRPLGLHSACSNFLPPSLHSTSWYLCDRCVELVFHRGQSLTLQNTRSGDVKFKVYEVRFMWPISISVLPVHSLDDGACHKHNLVGAGETIRRCIACSLEQPACEIRSSMSAPRFPE